MHSQMPPYRPVLYRPGAQGRYRAYPQQTVTPIPGAGYDADELAWAEQELDLHGGSPEQPYGNYAAVPLRGLGTLQLNTALLAQAPVLQLAPAPATPSFTPQGWDKAAATTAVTGGPGGRQEATQDDPPPLDLPPLELPPGEERRLVDLDQLDTVLPNVLIQVPAQGGGFFEKKVGPVPVWALGLGGLVAVGGAATWFFLRKRGRR